MSTCKESIELLLEYLDGTLEGELRAQLEQHFDGCQPCEEFLSTYRAIPGLCRRALAARMPPQMAAELAEFIRAHRHTRSE